AALRRVRAAARPPADRHRSARRRGLPPVHGTAADVIALGLLLALGSAAALNWGFFVQHGAASTLPRLELRRPLRSLALLLSNRRWLVGFLTGLGGWVLYVAALGLAPLSLVQATSAGGIGLLALLVHRASGGGLSRRELGGAWLSVGGLLLLG